MVTLWNLTSMAQGIAVQHHPQPEERLSCPVNASWGLGLPQQEALLGGVAEATRRLLAIADFDASVNGALEAIALGTGMDRIFVYQHQVDAKTQREFADCPYEWTRAGIIRSCDIPGQFPIFYDEIEGYSAWVAELKAGRAVQKLAREMSELGQVKQEQEQALSVLTVPILINGRYWGNLGFDDCTTERVWSDAEIAVLETAAASFAGALERRENLSELERRDALLASVNAASQVLVASDDLAMAIPEALRILGEGAQQDRVYVFENVFPEGPDEVFWEMPFEWNAPEIPASLEYGMNLPVPMSAFPPQINEPLIKGKAFRCLVRDLDGVALNLNTNAQALSLVGVPLRIDGQWWGLLGFDDCTTERVWLDAEVAVLETAAACIGSAIERDRTRKEREAIARDRTAELEAHNQELAARDRILEATAAAANTMLMGEDFDSAVTAALEIIGVGLEVDRVGLMKHFDATENELGYHQQMFEWDAVGISRQIEHPELIRVRDSGIEFVVEQLVRGEIFGGVVADLPEPFRSGQQEVGALSVYAVPILMNGGYWGIVALDDCHRQTQRSEAELEALRTLANCIGSAIEREQLRQAELQAQADREAAERTALIERERAARATELEVANQVLTIRDRWLTTTALAAKQLLSSNDVAASVDQALATIGENLDCDRISVMQHHPSPDTTEDTLGLMRVIHEWDGDGICRQMDNPDLVEIASDGVEDWFRQLLAGDSVGGIVEEMEEPFRSGQQSLGVQATYAVPVLVEGLVWGLVAMDYCHESKRLTPAELAVFQTAATCVGSSIYQEQVRRDQVAQESARLLGSVAEAANLLLRSADYTTVLPEVVKLLGEAVGSDRCAIATTQSYPVEPTSPLSIAAEWCKDGVMAAHHATPELATATWQQFPELYKHLQSEEVANYLVTELSESNRNLFKSQDISSVVYLPIVVDGKPWGQIGFDNCGEPRLYDKAEISILRVAAESIAAAIARQAQDEALRQSEQAILAEREKSAQERAAELAKANEAISHTLQTLASKPQLHEFLGQLILAIAKQIDARKVHLYLYDEATHSLNLHTNIEDGQVYAGASPSDIEFFHHPIPADITPAWQMIREAKDIVMNDRSSPLPDEIWWPGTKAWHQAQGHISMACIPMRAGEQTLGFIGFAFRDHTVLSDEQLEFMQALTNQAIVAVQLSRLAEEAKQTAVLQEQEKAAQERAAELAKTNEAISRTLSTLATKPELDTFLCLLVQELSESIGAINTGLFLYNAEADTLSRHIAVQDGQAYLGNIPRDTEMLRHPFPADITEIWQVILEAPQPLTFADIGAPEENPSNLWWDGTIAWHVSEEHREVAFARLKVGELPLGFIGFCFREKRTFSGEQLELVQALANQATLAIQLSRLAEEAMQNAVLQEQEKAAQDRAAELEKANIAIGQSLTTLITTPDLDEFLGQILSKMANQVEACKAHLFLYDETTDTLCQYMAVQEGQVYQGFAPNDPEVFRGPWQSQPFWQAVINSPKPLTLDERHPEVVDLYLPESLPWHQAQGHVSSVCPCLRVGNKPIGFIGFAFRHLPVLSDEQLEFIQALTNQATLSIHLTRLAEEAQQTAILQEQERAAQERVLQLAKTNDAIAQSLTDLASNPELEPFLGTIVAEMARHLNACKVHLFLYDAPSHTLTQRVVVQNGQIYIGVGPNDPEMFRHPVPADLTPGWQVILSSERPLTYDETQPYDEDIWWPESLEWHKAEGHKAITCIPMKAGETPIGYIGFCFYDRTLISDEQLEFMQALANQAIVAIQLTRLADEAKQNAILQERETAARERAAQLTRSNQALKSSLDSLAQQPELDAFLQRLVNEAAAQTGAANAHLFLSDEASNACWLHFATDNSGDWRVVPDMAIWLQPCPQDKAPAFWELIYKKEPVVIENLKETLVPGPHIWEPSIAWHLKRNHTSFICAPLVLGDRVLGFLGLPFVGTTTINPEDVELAQALTNQATLAIQLTRLADEAKQNAILQEKEKAAQDRVTELAKTNEAIAQTLNALTTDPELDRFLGQILTCIIEQIGADDTHLFLYDAETHTLRSHLAVQNGVVYTGTAPNDPEIFSTDVPADITAVWQIVISSLKPLILNDQSSENEALFWPTTQAWHESRGHQSATCVCMKIGDEPIGFIGFAFCEKAVLTSEQLEFIQALTNQATLAIHLTRLAEQARTNALTDERTRLAREIHDTLAQAFTGVSLQLEAVRSLTDQPDPIAQNLNKAQPFIRRARDLARQGLSEARRSVQALRSEALETDALPEALRKALRQTQRDTNLTTHFHLEGAPTPLPDDLQLNLLRIAQEAITNALRHAHATQLDLTLSFTPQAIRLNILDNGIGFKLQSLVDVTGFGLIGIRERSARFNGTVQITSNPNQGTLIEVTIPTQPHNPLQPSPAIP